MVPILKESLRKGFLLMEKEGLQDLAEAFFRAISKMARLKDKEN